MCKILKLMDQEDDLYSSVLQGCAQTENTLGKTKEKDVPVIEMQDIWILARLDNTI